MVLALVLGGGTVQALWTDRILELALIPALLIGLVGINDSRWSNAAKALAFGTLVLFAIQFLPIGRQWPNSIAPVAEGLFLTTAADRTFESLLFFVPVLGFALFLSQFSDQEHERLLRFIVVGLLINLVVGALQLSASDGDAASDTFLPYALRAGVFANQNHFSTLVFCTIPIVAYFFLFRQKRPLIFAGLLVSMLTYLLAVGSRAGMGLSLCIATVSVLTFAPRYPLRRFRFIFIFGIAVLAAAALALQPELFTLEGTSRGNILATTIRALSDHWLVGTGIGSFQNIYPTYESVSDITGNYVNHAHNEYAEIALETGIAGLALVTAFFVLLLKGSTQTRMATAFALGMVAIAAHSLVDYPLRTMGIAMLFAFFASHVLVHRGPTQLRARTKTPASET